jgi:hypothetical protein
MRRLRRASERHARQQIKKSNRFKQSALAAGTAAVITLGAGLSLNKVLAAQPPDRHELPVAQDTDEDLLSDSEEAELAYRVSDPDQNRNEMRDGVELARLSAAEVNELPWENEALPGQTYKWWAPQFGVEQCDICGEWIGMGPGGVVNPRLGISADFPFLLTLHYMEHGSFSYAGHYGEEPRKGRVDVPALLRALELRLPCDPEDHQLPVPGDTDEDLLSDKEENELGYLVLNPDQNRNEILDGVELATLSAAEVDGLPWEGEALPGQTYKWWAPQHGLEHCDICGEPVVMGPGGVVNPQRSISVEFPFLLTLHYMEHGSFSYAGHFGPEPREGRVDVPGLLRALELRLPCEGDDHQLPVPDDVDEDMLSNGEEYAIGYQPFNPDQNRNEISDGVELGKRCSAAVAELPSYPIWPEPPDTNEIYKVEHAVDGVEQCEVCGDWIHMGGWTIINPRLGLKYPDPCDPMNYVFLPDLALHYMEHGSFDCFGSIHKGRVQIARLMRVLELRFPYDPNEHQLPLDFVPPESPGADPIAPDANDLDKDLLADSEELAAGYDLYDADQDKNLLPDGIELAEQCASIIDELPEYDPHSGDPPPKETYKINLFQRGIEGCFICGANRNMGYWEIVNPTLQLSIDVPDITCHYMEHGSFSFGGSVHGWGRIDVPLLVKILGVPRRCGDLGTLYLPGDLNKDCDVNFKDLGKFASDWLDSTEP